MQPLTKLKISLVWLIFSLLHSTRGKNARNKICTALKAGFRTLVIQQNREGFLRTLWEGEIRDSTTWTCSSAFFKSSQSLVKPHTALMLLRSRREDISSRKREKERCAFGAPKVRVGQAARWGYVCNCGMQQLARQDSLCRLSPFLVFPTPATST